MHLSAAWLNTWHGNTSWRVPAWVFEPRRFLDRAWHVSSIDAPAMREYLTFSSPAEFRSRNIFTEERPLRRVRSVIAD